MRPSIIKTPRLILRKFEILDAKGFYELNLDAEVMKYTGDVPFASVEESENLIKNYANYERDGYGRWSVVAKEDLRLLGWCGLKKHPEGFVDLGYRFFRKEWGKGYATEASNACVDYGFKELGLSEIIGRTAKDNLASIRVLEKIGMIFWKEDACEGIENSVYYRIQKY